MDQEAAEPLTEDEVRSVLLIYKDGDINSKDFQETLFDAFLIRAYVYEDTLKIVFNTTQEHKEVDIPFDIDQIESEEDKCLYNSTRCSTNKKRTFVYRQRCVFCWRALEDSNLWPTGS